MRRRLGAGLIVLGVVCVLLAFCLDAGRPLPPETAHSAGFQDHTVSPVRSPDGGFLWKKHKTGELFSTDPAGKLSPDGLSFPAPAVIICISI